MLRQLPVRRAADVILLLADVLLLGLPFLELPVEALVAQADVLLVAAGVTRDPLGVEFDGLVRHLLQEIPVVADDDHALRLAREVSFEPARRVDVEVVARFVEQHDVRRRQQQLREQNAPLLTAAEADDLAVEVLLQKAEAGEHVVDFVVERVGVVGREEFVQAVVLIGELLLFERVVAVRHLVGDGVKFLLGRQQFVEGALRLFVQRPARRELGDLPEQVEPRPGVPLDAPGFRFVLPAEDPHQRGFAGAVGPHEADPLPGVEFERNLLEERGRIVATGDVRAGQQQHGRANRVRVGTERQCDCIEAALPPLDGAHSATPCEWSSRLTAVPVVYDDASGKYSRS